MRQVILGLTAAALMTAFAGCDQAQKALDTIDKAKTLTEDVQKKAKEVTDKAREIIPGNDRGESGDKGEKDGEKDD